MGWFDDEKEEEGTEAEAPDAAEVRRRIPLDESGKPSVRDYIAQKMAQPKEEMGPSVNDANLDVRYKRLADDDSGVKAARDDADSKNRWLDVMQGVSTMFGGRANTDSGFYNTKRSQNAAKVADAEKDKQLKLSDLVTGDKLGYQSVERGRAATKDEQVQKEFGWKESNNEPDSNAAKAARLVTSKEFGVEPKLLDGLSYEQIKDLRLQRKEQGSGKGRRTLQAVEVDGKTQLAWVDPDAGTIVPTGVLKGFAQGYDGTTGTTFSKAAPGQGAASLLSTDGKPMADVRTELTGERAQASEVGKQQAKDDHSVVQAESAAVRAGDMDKKYMGLYDSAEKESLGLGLGGVGTVDGRVSEAANSLGVSTGPATDTLITGLTRDLNSYIHETTGAAMSEPEAKRLARVMPSAGMDRALFQSKLKESREEADRIIADRKRVAGQASRGTTASPASSSEVTRKTKDGREAVFNADTKEFIRWK